MADRVASATAAQTVVFHRQKAGSTDAEWEDCAAYDPGDPATGRAARQIVVDGATEAYDALRWVDQLVTSFLGADGSGPPALTAQGLDSWFRRMQERWIDEAPRTFATIFEERKFHEDGSFATFLGCEVHGLGGPHPHWIAAALGDTVLFQVRDGRVVEQFPELAPEEFDLNPDGIHTRPSQLPRMRSAMRIRGGPLQVGDLLFIATDALAEWLTRTSRTDRGACWQAMAAIEHPTDFARLITGERRARRMKNDDVTLLRVEVTPADADLLVVCR